MASHAVSAGEPEGDRSRENSRKIDRAAPPDREPWERPAVSGRQVFSHGWDVDRFRHNRSTENGTMERRLTARRPAPNPGRKTWSRNAGYLEMVSGIAWEVTRTLLESGTPPFIKTQRQTRQCVHESNAIYRKRTRDIAMENDVETVSGSTPERPRPDGELRTGYIPD